MVQLKWKGFYVNVYKDKSFMHVKKRSMHPCIKLKPDKKNTLCPTYHKVKEVK